MYNHFRRQFRRPVGRCTISHVFVIAVDYPLCTVIGMAPDVEGVTALVEELNKTQNLTEFCKTVRQKFKRIALEW